MAIMQHIQLLFTLDLQYVKGKERVLSEAGRVGDYLGSGEGQISGERLSGTVEWDLFEKVEESVCESNLRGVITSDDGTLIHFDTLGFFRPPADSEDSIWQNASAVTFRTEDERYSWLNNLTASWQGRFDMSAYQHHYTVFALSDAP